MCIMLFIYYNEEAINVFTDKESSNDSEMKFKSKFKEKLEEAMQASKEAKE